MDPRVPCERGLIAEALPTLSTGEGPLACVRALVHRQVSQVLEALPARPAGIRPLLGVAALVHGEVGLLAEALPAPGAGIRTLARVRPLVLVEVGRVGEGLPARPAGVGPLAGVQPLMGGEGGEVAKAFAAGAAGVGLHPGVGPLVGLQVGQAAEGLPAFPTWVRTLLAARCWFCPWFLGVLRGSGWSLGRWEGGGIFRDRSGVEVGLGNPGGGVNLGDVEGMRGVSGGQDGVLQLRGTCWGEGGGDLGAGPRGTSPHSSKATLWDSLSMVEIHGPTPTAGQNPRSHHCQLGHNDGG